MAPESREALMPALAAEAAACKLDAEDAAVAAAEADSPIAPVVAVVNVVMEPAVSGSVASTTGSSIVETGVGMTAKLVAVVTAEPAFDEVVVNADTESPLVTTGATVVMTVPVTVT